MTKELSRRFGHMLEGGRGVQLMAPSIGHEDTGAQEIGTEIGDDDGTRQS